MKAFVAITLFAACVAAQTIDYPTGYGHQRQLLKRLRGHDQGVSGLWKDIFGINKDYKYDFDTTRTNTNSYYPYTIPTTYNYNQQNTWDINANGVNTNSQLLSLDEIIRHPLFQTYYTLPLFRQHFNHPLFKLYLTTPYFQQYWTQPIFTTFFRNPYLFNKYIYPIIYNTVATGVYDYDHDNYADDVQNIYGDYKTNTHQTTTTTYPFNTIYGKKYNTNIEYPFNTGYPINNKHIQYANIMDKIIKTLLINTNKPEITQMNYDFQTPIQKNIFEKTIDPITGEIKYTTDGFKTIDDKYTINHNNHLDAMIERELKSALIKKIFLNKIMYGDRKIDQNIPEIFKYQTTYPREFIPRTRTIMTPFNNYETVMPRDILTRDFPAKYTITPIQKEEIETTIPRDILNKFENIPRDLLAKYTINPIHKEEIETIPRKFIINRFGTTFPREQMINKMENIPIEKIERIPITKTEGETIPRVMTNEETIPREHIHHKTENIPEITKKLDEMENKIEEITGTDENVEKIRTKRHATTLYTVPATQYVYAAPQHYAQVPVKYTTTYNTPLTYTYGTQYTVPATYTYAYGVQQPSVYYPTHTYITA